MLTNSQYNKISGIYDARRFAAIEEKNRRLAEVINKQPAIADINEALADNSVKAARLFLLNGDSELLDNLEANNNLLIQNKKMLIRNAGFPEDYLEDVYKCPICKDTGVIKPDGKRCVCFSKTLIEALYIDDARKELLERENFDTFDMELYSRTNMNPGDEGSDFDVVDNSVTDAYNFADSFKEPFMNLLISGNTGTGKTFLANCISKKLMDEGIPVLFIPHLHFIEVANDSVFAKDEAKLLARDELEIITNCECLILDDLGAEMSTAFTTQALYDLIEKRNLAKRPTVITTNLSEQNIKNQYSERISSRLLSQYKFLRMPGGDLRRKTSAYI